MRKVPFSLLLFLFTAFLPVSAQFAQPPAQVPSSVRFADMIVRFDDGAKRIIQQDINALIQSNRRYWEAKLDRVVLYFPVIENVLQSEQVPVDFKYLAVQESSLTPDAVSASTAVGYWQFKRETATDHGLRVDDEVDERKSIVASTRGAARYFKRSNTVYNNWVSALFSYYLGMGGISKLVSPDWVNSKDITLDARTDRYVLRFFAHKIAIESVIPAYRSTNAITLVEYPSGSGKTVAHIASELNVDEQDIRRYNRWILGEAIPSDKEYVLAIPVLNEQVASVRQKIPASTFTPSVSPTTPVKMQELARSETGFPVLRKVNYSKNRPDVVLYEINGLPGIQAVRNDNVTTLARKARISASSFLRYNDMSDRHPVKEGTVYYLAKKMKKAAVPFHNVYTGETLHDIAQMYGIRLKRLKRYNRITDSDEPLQVGRVMWLRERRPANTPIEVVKPVPTQAPVEKPVVAQNRNNASDWESSRSAPTSRPTNGAIPKNASERKLYSPKLVDSAPASEPTTRPTVTESAPVTQSNNATYSARSTTPKPTPSPVSSAPVSQPSQPSLSESAPEPVVTPAPAPNGPDSERRVVIIRPEGQAPAQSDDEITETPAKTETASKSMLMSRPTPGSTAGGSTASASTSRPATPKPSVSAPTTPAPSAESRPATTRTGSQSVTHKVEPGQTYYSISRIYGVTIDDLLAWNNLTLDDKLSVGQSIQIKGAGQTAQTPTASQPAPKSVSNSTSSQPANQAAVSEEIIYHTVQKGETLFRISKEYGVTVEQIQNWNQLSDGSVKVGQQIKIIKK